MDISITESINCSVIEKGSVLLYQHILYHDIVRKIPDGNEIEFIANEGKEIFNYDLVNQNFLYLVCRKKIFPLIEIDKLEL